MLKLFLKAFVELTGNRFVSKQLMSVTKSRASRRLVPLFAKVYKINQQEMALPLTEYSSLQHLFTRLLKPGTRPIDNEQSVFVSPVDGVISAFGPINEKEAYKVKNNQLGLKEMLGSREKADKYKNGMYIIFYLSPRHYHRIHSPVKGTVTSNWTLGGKSYPVNRFGLKYGERPLSTNFRTITEIKSIHKNVAVVKVGALNVNSIHLTNQHESIEPGEELAYFSFGSTVILLIENENFQFTADLNPGQEVKYGEKIGSISSKLL